MNSLNKKSNTVKRIFSVWVVIMTTTSLMGNLQAREVIEKTHREGNVTKTLDAGCGAPTTQTDLDISGVRATILTGGDMWWNLVSAKYEVPKQEEKAKKRTAIFTGTLWVGGYDQNNVLKTACQFYRQSGGNDFWPGPLDTIAAGVTPDVCVKYDRHWKLNRTDVENFVGGKAAPTVDILTWPGNGEGTQAHYLAPFEDVDGDGLYNSAAGDYPRFNISGKPIQDYRNYLLGDQVLWWVFNDKGNTHLESRGAQIGLEIRAQAFAFNKPASDPVGLMTFYSYQIINRSTNTLNQAYFGVFVDADLGAYKNDYVGCDANLGLGFCYNGTPFDHGTPGGYNDPPFDESTPPPCIGVDFFEGPLADKNGKDDPKDSTRSGTGYGDLIIDNEKLGMSRFMYFNNDGSPNGNPSVAQDYYNYLIGKWKDGKQMKCGGNGYNTATGGPCKYMFPDNTDSIECGNIWNEVTAGNQPDDRRFVQSAGPFTLKPGAVNYITFGVVYGHAVTGNNYSSVGVVKNNDKLAQSLFDSKFSILRGPTAPTLEITELDKQLVITIVNPSTGNNAHEDYKEDDPTIIEDPANGTVGTKTYSFEGYQVYQLKSPQVTDIFDPETGALDESKAKVVAQCDLKDTIDFIDNFVDKQDGNHIPVPMVARAAESANDGLDKGIRHTFVLNKDQFNNTDAVKAFVNNRPCYFYVVAYALNKKQYQLNQRFKKLDATPIKYYKPYVGSSGLTVYKGIPHIPTMQNGGMVLQSKVGDGVPMTRIWGSGNGLSSLNIDSAAISKILKNNKLDTLTYAQGGSPIDITVIDPTKVPTFDLVFKMDGVSKQSNWTLSAKGEQPSATQSLSSTTDAAIKKWGISIKALQTDDPGVDNFNNNNGAIQLPAPLYSDSTNKWFTPVNDDDGSSKPVDVQADNQTLKYNWIASGTDSNAAKKDYYGLDDGEFFEKLTKGTSCAPFALCRAGTDLPGYGLTTTDKKNCLKNTSSVLVVLTPNKNEWTRSPIIETSENANSTVGLSKFDLRTSPSVDKNGKTVSGGASSGVDNPDAADYVSPTGLGWFPGYAIDMNTGERLNIMFGEETFNGENGKDMLWNPSSKQVVVVSNENSGEQNFVIGGKHFTYILGHNGNMPAYDKGAYIASQLTLKNKAEVFKNAMWAFVPVLAPGKSMANGVPITKTTFRLLAAKSYKAQRYNGDNSGQLPSYMVNTTKYGALINNSKAAKDALEQIRAVPNPYYAHSAYEDSRYDNIIKITNLPSKYTISIFSIDGTLVKTVTEQGSNDDLSRGGEVNQYSTVQHENAYTWDLKNNAGITISSGIYIIHVKADGIGEKTIKWFGVLRPLDIQDF